MKTASNDGHSENKSFQVNSEKFVSLGYWSNNKVMSGLILRLKFS